MGKKLKLEDFEVGDFCSVINSKGDYWLLKVLKIGNYQMETKKIEGPKRKLNSKLIFVTYQNLTNNEFTFTKLNTRTARILYG